MLLRKILCSTPTRVHSSIRLCAGVYRGVTTSELDELAAETAASLTATHPDYAVLAARIAISNLHKNTEKSFSGTIDKLYNHTNPASGTPCCCNSLASFLLALALLQTPSRYVVDIELCICSRLLCRVGGLPASDPRDEGSNCPVAVVLSCTAEGVVIQ